jgi:glutathione synthase
MLRATDQKIDTADVALREWQERREQLGTPYVVAVRGGTPKETELAPREREICAKLGAPLRERGLLFVGIDVIDGYLTEINVTSPTGIRAVKNFGGPDVAAMIWDRIEAKRLG